MESVKLLSNTFDLSYARIEELFVELCGIDSKYFVADEEILPEILVKKLHLKKNNEIRLIYYVSFCCIHIN